MNRHARRNALGRAERGPEPCRHPFPDPDGAARGAGPVDDSTIEDMTRRLRGARRERGPGRADAEWMDGPLDDWLDHLDEGDPDLDGDVMAALAVGMDEALSIRDALIISLVAGRECDREVMMDIIARPSAPEVAATVRDLLAASLGDDWEPDLERCRTGVAMLVGIGEAVPRRLAAQPLASIAYILWWLDDLRAPLYAMRSLEADGSCSLAALVLHASDRDVHPAGRSGLGRHRLRPDGPDPCEGPGPWPDGDLGCPCGRCR